MAENLNYRHTPKPPQNRSSAPQERPLQARPQNEQNLSQQKQIEDLKNRALDKRALQDEEDPRGAPPR